MPITANIRKENGVISIVDIEPEITSVSVLECTDNTVAVAFLGSMSPETRSALGDGRIISVQSGEGEPVEIEPGKTIRVSVSNNFSRR